MYVKWFGTVMFYYVILVYLVNVTLSFSNFPPFRPPYVPTLAGDRTQMTDAGIGWISLPGTLQEGHRGEQDKVSEEQIPEQRRMVSTSVARGYRFCYTREYRQGGY
ncbi:unnamed protein product, partial [Staurois parvus]